MAVYDENAIFGIYIDGVKLPPFSVPADKQYSDLDAEAIRSFKTGRLHRNRIRSNVLSFNCIWEAISPEDAKKITNLVNKPEFQVTLWNDLTGQAEVKTMYRSADMVYKRMKVYSYKGQKHIVYLSFSLIEV